MAFDCSPNRIKPLGVYTHLLCMNSKQEKTFANTGSIVAGLELQSGKVGNLTLCKTAVTHKLDCLKYCLRFTGMGLLPVVSKARLERTKLLKSDRLRFLSLLFDDLLALQCEAKKQGIPLAIRLNTFSDLPWLPVIKRFPDIQFFDYTKEKERYRRFLRGDLPSNYHLTFSASEIDRDHTLKGYLNQGGTVAVGFKLWRANGQLPKRYLGSPVIDGDTHDLRYTDPRGAIIGLRNKGKLSGKDTDFSRPVPILDSSVN